MLKGHGDDRYLFDCEIKADFSSNVIANYPLIIPQHLKDLCWASIGRYPEPNANSLTQKLADFHQISPQQILVTNGATEAFYLIAKAFEGSSAGIFMPTFAEYKDACRTHHIEVEILPWDKIKEGTCLTKASLLFVCNPNNPTGTALRLDQVRTLLEEHPHTHIVLDEAYIDFSDQCSSAVSLLDDYPTLILVKSLTKSFAIPGLRLGYILSSSSTIAAITQYKMPWSNNVMALEVGAYLIEHYEQLIFNQALLRQQTEQFRAQINAIGGFKAHPTSTNYFLVQLETGKASDLKAFLVQEHGILIRDAANFEGLDSSYCRLACQTATKNNLLIEALKKWKQLSLSCL